MANKPLKSITFPGLPDTYTFAQIDDTLTVAGKAADAKTVGDEIADLKADLNQKANIDGSYESMTVGNSEQLLSTTYNEDSVPYLYRTSGGSADVGNREYVDAIVGGSLVHNQYVKNANFEGTNEWLCNNGVITSADNELTYKINTIGTNYFDNQVRQHNMDIPSGHVLFMSVETFAPYNNGFYMSCRTNSVGQTGVGISNVVPTPNTWSRFEKITKLTNVLTDIAFYWSMNKNYEVDDIVKIRTPQVIDLTQMFGSSVADAIYSAEQASAGAGVNLFRILFPKTYYAYDAGTLKSVEGLTAHKMVGFNQWDEEIEAGQYNSTTGVKESYSGRYRSKNFIPCLPDTTYYHNVNMQIFYYDSDKNFISVIAGGLLSARTFTTPSNCHYMTFVVSEATKNTENICINLSWSGYRNGEYEAYKEYVYPLDSTLTLRGIPKVDASGNLYYDGDRYLPDGTVERRYGVVDLGTLTWTYQTDGSYPIFRSTSINAVVAKSDNSVCARYTLIPNASANTIKEIAQNMIYTITTSGVLGNICVRDDSYTDVNTFKTAMSGVLLVYELTTPTTETADPYASLQTVDDFGTEEYVIDSQIAVPVPVGHETKYLVNLRDKLQHLPDLASADGYYLIQQVGHKMELVHFRIPQAPSVDGTYTLKATVSGGTPTYTWEAVE